MSLIASRLIAWWMPQERGQLVRSLPWGNSSVAARKSQKTAFIAVRAADFEMLGNQSPASPLLIDVVRSLAISARNQKELRPDGLIRHRRRFIAELLGLRPVALSI